MTRSLKTSHRSSRLKLGASALVLGMMAAVASPALAQDTPAADEETVVVVTGLRGQLRTAQSLKKNSDVVQDSVTAVDIGALPDRSVAEALQRVSGLQIQRANEARDPIRMTAEGGGVAIRGLSWVRSETNGRDIFSARNGRSLSWDDVSADLLGGIDVFKNPSANMIEGGIGGTINLKTRLPFDSRGRVLAFSVDDTYGDLQQTHHQSYSGIWSDRFDTGIGEFGVLLNYSVADVGNYTNVIGVDRYNAVDIDPGSATVTRFVPNTMGWRTIDWNQKREAIAFAAQWRPMEGLLFTLQAFNSVATPQNTEYNVGFYNDTGEINAGAAGYTYNSQGVFQSGTIDGAGITANTRWGDDRKETTDVSLGMRWNVTDKLTVSGDLQHVKSTADVLSNTVFVQYCETQVRTTGCDSSDKVDAYIDVSSGELPTILIDTPNDTALQSSYYWAAAMDHVEKNDGEQTAMRLDATYDFDEGTWLKSFEFGVRATDRDYITRQSNWNWSYLSHQYWGSGGGSGAVYLDETGGFDLGWASAAANPNLPNMSELVSFDGFMHGDVPVPGNIWFPSKELVANGTAYTFEQLKAVETAGWGWAPASTDWASYAGNGGLNVQNEKTQAVYGLLRFGQDDVFGAQTLDGNVGVRVVTTKVKGDSYVVMGALTGPVGMTCAVNCTLYNSVQTFGAGSTFAYGGENEYTDTLPSLNLRYRYNDELQFRFAASKAIVRPELSWLSPYSTLSANDFIFTDLGNGTFSVNDSNANLTGTGGTPTLEPIKADQFDLTAEWYFAPTGSLTLALFHKNLTNYIYVESGVETYTNNGVTLNFNVNRYVNGSEDGKVSGFEIAYNQFYDFLPAPWNGLGIQANYTKIDSSGGRNGVYSVTDGNAITNASTDGLPLEGMSPDSYNFAVLYEKYGISARFAYNWRSTYLLTTSAANVNRPMWAQAYGQLDGSIFYTLNDRFKVGVQATNVARDVNYIRVSSDLSKPLDTQYYSATKTDRRVSLVLRGNF